MHFQPCSRRKFLVGSLATFACGYEWAANPAALAKRVKEAVASGPHPLAREDWPPAIVPDSIGIVDRGYCGVADEFGRLAVVDLRKPAPNLVPKVISQTGGLGKKVIALQMLPARGFAVVLKGSENSEPQLTLVCISFAPVTEPHVVTELPLERYQEVTALAVKQDLVCVGGTSISGENLVTVFRVARGRQPSFSMSSTLTTSSPIVDMTLGEHTLLILQSGQLDYVSLLDVISPQLKKSLALNGDFRILTSFKDVAVVSGTDYSASGEGKSGGTCVAKSIQLEPEAHVVMQLPLAPITSVLDAAAQKDQFLILGEGNTDRYVASLSYDRSRELQNRQTLVLPKDRSASYGTHSSILLNNRTAYIASGWAGVQILNFNGAWQPVYNYTIPRLPASSVAAWGNNVVLAGTDLKLYDIAQPEHPALVSTADVLSNVKSIVGAGSFVLCLSKDGITLRKMEKINETVAACKLSGQQLCYDSIDQSAYVLKDLGTKTAIIRLKLYSNGVVQEKSYELPGKFVRASAHGSLLALTGLNDVSLYRLGDSAELIGTRHFANRGLRDLVLRDSYIIASAVDQTSKGFLLVLSKDQKDLKVLGSTDLPHDAVALAATETQAVVVGKRPDGKDLAAIVDISTPSAPRSLAVIAAVEAASAVTIRDKLAIIAGRGFEIVTLT